MTLQKRASLIALLPEGETLETGITYGNLLD